MCISQGVRVWDLLVSLEPGASVGFDADMFRERAAHSCIYAGSLWGGLFLINEASLRIDLAGAETCSCPGLVVRSGLKYGGSYLFNED